MSRQTHAVHNAEKLLLDTVPSNHISRVRRKLHHQEHRRDRHSERQELEDLRQQVNIGHFDTYELPTRD